MEPYVVVVGRNVIDEYYVWPNFPEKGNKVFLIFQNAVPGGYMINTAAVIGALGAKCYVLDTLGDDKYTGVHMNELNGFGVDTSYIKVIPGAENSRAIIAREEGESERTIFLFDRTYPAIPLDGKNMELIKKAKIVYTNMRDTRLRKNYRELVKEMKSQGALLAFDAETTTFTSAEEDAFFFENADILSLNDFAYDKYTKGKGDSAFNRLFELTPGLIIMNTMGDKGCRIITRDEKFSVPAFDVEPVDTTGAGDTFNGTFLYGLVKGWDLKKCATYACAAGARATQSTGPRTGAVPICEIEKFICEHRR